MPTSSLPQSIQMSVQNFPSPSGALSIHMGPETGTETGCSSCVGSGSASACLQACRTLLKNTAALTCMTVCVGGFLSALPTIGVLCAMGLHHKGPLALPENCGFSPPPMANSPLDGRSDDYLGTRYGNINLDAHPCGPDYAKNEINLRGGAIVSLGITGMAVLGILLKACKDAINSRRGTSNA